jgi:GH24 family phage-related lysozyme (muramidase)
MAVLKWHDEYLILGGIGAYIAYQHITFKARLIGKLSTFIPSVEGFRASPYWDVSRYSWGYGTAAPGPSGSISRPQAFTEMLVHLMNDYDVLRPQVQRPLSTNQWTAYLSFSYSVGVGNADNLLVNINSGNDTALAAQWRKYIYAGGVVNQNLVQRREKELALWFT